MTTPPPPAQDGERERLVSMLDDCVIPTLIGKRAALMIRTDTESMKSLVDRLEEVEVALDEKRNQVVTQSAELAALRAQVAERDAAWWCWLNERGLIRGADGVLQYMAVVHQVDAALAPPQPTKESK